MTARATAIGFSAVAMWALLALFTDASGEVPPFQLAAMSFTLGAGLGFALRLMTGRAAAAARPPLAAWLVGIAGLFGYHFFYFTALRNAPAAEASLIAYLWPLFIVIGSALMPGERLRWHHVAGALLGHAANRVEDHRLQAQAHIARKTLWKVNFGGKIVDVSHYFI